MDQMRIIKEMRARDARDFGRTGKFIRPRYMVWENVEGAKTSPGGERRGEDFAAVIEEVIRVAEQGADIHVCVPTGGWPNAGCYYAEDGSWSLAWRLVDAQWFGTPQRRKRICLLADFGGLTAPEILFDPQYERQAEGSESVETESGTASSGAEVFTESSCVSGNPEPCGAAREGVAAGTESGFGGSSYTLKIRGGVDIDSAGKRAGKGPLVQTELSGTLGVSQDQTLIQTAPVMAFAQNQRDEVRDLGDLAGSVSAETGTHQQTFVATAVDGVAVDVYNQTIDGDVAATLTAQVGVPNHSGPKIMAAGFSFGQSPNARSIGYQDEKSPTITGGGGGNNKPVVLAVDCRNGTEDPNVNGTLQAKPNGGISYNCNNVVREQIPFGISGMDSNGMKSDNPNVGFYKAESSRTLDVNGGNPACNQGGVAVVEKCWPLEGNGSRPSHFGNGYGQEGDPSFTLNHVEQHGVATYDARGNGDGAVACTLTGDHQDRVTDYTALVVENDSE